MNPFEAQDLDQRSLFCYLGQRFFFILSFQMRSIAVVWQVYALTHRPLDLGFVGLAQFLPVISFSLIAGHVADRYSRKNILILTYCLDLLCSIFLCFLSTHHASFLMGVYPLLFFMGTVRAFASAAGQSLLANLVPASSLARAVGWNSSLIQVGFAIGPSVGGLVYGMSSSESVIYMASAAVMTVGIILLIFLRVPLETREKEPVTWQTVFAGIRYIRRTRVILGAISMDLFAVLLGGVVALLPAFASDILKVGPMGLGVLRSAPGVGALCMGVFLGFFPLQRAVGKKMYACVTVFGIATIFFGISRNFYFSLACLFLLGASDLVSVVIRQTLVQVMTPDQMRGRVSAVNMVFIGASNELGEFESGVTAAWWGIVPAAVLGGIGTCAVVLLWTALFPELLKQEKLEPLKRG